MSLVPPEKLQKLQATLHAKAKAAPNQRFHALYDKVYRADVLAHAYVCCQANGGAAGVDGWTFAAIEAYGRERWLGEVAETLKPYRGRRLAASDQDVAGSSGRGARRAWEQAANDAEQGRRERHAAGRAAQSVAQ